MKNLSENTLARIRSVCLKPHPGVPQDHLEAMFSAVSEGFQHALRNGAGLQPIKLNPLLAGEMDPLEALLGRERACEMLSRLGPEDRRLLGLAPLFTDEKHDQCRREMWMTFSLFGRAEITRSMAERKPELATA
ncbi:MAG TPA: hypothetical protein VFQ72_03240 [Candidatus Paceibacterota bacterium]|nr:hypothetical protein [Candidatus Paceibacterota bacterium]